MEIKNPNIQFIIELVKLMAASSNQFYNTVTIEPINVISLLVSP